MDTYGRSDGYLGRSRASYAPRGSFGSTGITALGGKDIEKDLVFASSQTLQKPFCRFEEDDAACQIKNVSYVASYNWVASEEPTILVPGSPGVWREPGRRPFSVPPDSGLVYIDQNGARVPSYPLLPLFRAADIMRERRGQDAPLDWRAVDVVTDRNNLRKLLGWLGSGTRREDFRIDIELAGTRTLLLQRWESRASEVVSEWRGFGHSYEKHCTSTPPGLQRWESTGHHRVISYDLAGLKFVVRSEVDACLALGSGSGGSADALADAMSSLNFQLSEPRAKANTAYGVKVVEAGTKVPQSSLIELKTRSVRNADSFDWADAYLQLYLGQTPRSIMGVHRAGLFVERREKSLDSGYLKQIGKGEQRRLKQLGELLRDIRKAASKQGGVKLSLLCRSGVLQLVERESSGSLLPAAVLDRFHV